MQSMYHLCDAWAPPARVSVRGVRGAAERRGRAGHGLLPAGLRRGGPGLPGAGVGISAQLQVTSPS